MAATPPWKPNVPGGIMAASAGINTFFTVNCLIDVSVARWAVEKSKVAHLQQYLEWREEEQFLKGIMFILLLGLPGAFFGMAYGVWGTVRGHRASRLRHFADCGQFVTLWCVLLPTVLTVLIPRLQAMLNCPVDKEEHQVECRERAVQFGEINVVMLVLNLFMLLWDSLKYIGNSKEADAETPPKKAE